MAASIEAVRRAAPAQRIPRERITGIGTFPYVLTVALVAITIVAAAATFFVPGILRGPAVMNGSARGTALVLLLVAAPTVAVSIARLSQGHARAAITLVGGLIFIAYNAVVLIFDTPFNSLFLLYVAMLSLAVWSIVAVLVRTDITALRGSFGTRLPVVGIATYSLAVAGLNFLAWMAGAVPAVLSSKAPAFLEGTGATTNPMYVLDLGFTLPLVALGAIWLWQRRPWGYLIVGSMLTMFVIESLSIATDQWFGHAADPTSQVASAAMTPAFAIVTVIGLVPLALFFRNRASAEVVGPS